MFKSTDYYKVEAIDKVYEQLGTIPEKGLDDLEVKKRIDEYGYNEINEKEEPKWLKMTKKFWGPIPWMIEVAAILSFILQKWDDFFIILALLITNVFVEDWQESKAESALELLKKKLETKAIVLRNGDWKGVSSRELVIGDIVRLRLGNIIPADVKLISGEYVMVDQSALTGESLPITKKKNDVAYANSIVKQGEMNGIVVNTGINTFFGETAKLIVKADKQKESHYQKAVMKISDFLIIITLVLVSVIIGTSLFRHDNFLEILKFSLVLTVASIPVALPAVLSVTMAVGATNLAKKKAIVTKLNSIEELAGMDVLCSDKTGTLTKNELKVSDPIPKKPYTIKDVLIYASLASKKENEDQIDLSILDSLKDNKLEGSLSKYDQQNFLPFDPVKKRTEAFIKSGKKKFKVTKGAPQIILDLCVNITSKERESILNLIEDYASRGYRTLGVAITKKLNDDSWKWVGLIPISDPPREDSKETLAEAKKLNVNVKMITGDNVSIAKEIARILGLGENIRRAKELTGKSSEEIVLLGRIITKALYSKLGKKNDETAMKNIVSSVEKDIEHEFENAEVPPGYIKKHESEIIDLIESADGFAEVYPEHKYYIVSKLEERNHIVGMTGDGVNDAPALKKANCGIAVLGATDAARAASDLVLTTPGLSVIIDAITEARKIFKRMNTYAIYRIAETIRVILFMTFAILAFNFYPVTALMIILLAFLNDLPILAIAYDNVKASEDVEKWDFTTVLTVSSLLGITGVMASFGIFYVGRTVLHFSGPILQSFIFLKLVISGHLTIFNTRTTKAFWTSRPSNLLLWSAIITKVIATLFVVYGIFVAPIGWGYAGIVWVYALTWFLIADLVKVKTYELLDRMKKKEEEKENSSLAEPV